MNWHAIEVSKVIDILESNKEGLSYSEAQKRLKKYGYNELETSKPKTAADIFLSQFKDVLLWILMIASVVSFFIGDVLDSVVILGIVIINAIIGFYQEYSAEKSLQALRKMIQDKAKVKRDGILKVILSKEIVPGDIVYLEAGDVVPADLRLIEINNLEINEASLTGESLPVQKQTEILPNDIVLGDKKNMAFKGTHVVKGKGLGIVTSTGLNTELGKIAHYLSEYEDTETPLKRKLKEFGKNLTYIILVVCILFFLYGYLSGKNILQTFMLSISLAVAAIPEALPAIITITLSKGAHFMSRKNALIRKLHAVETLGSISVICTDKTGTLTENKMKLENIVTDENAIYIDNLSISDFILALCNDVNIHNNKLEGEPTELALVEHIANKLGIDTIRKLKERAQLIDEIPFDSSRKRMSTLYEINGKYYVLVKGAFESIESNSVYYTDKMRELSEKWSNEGMRVIALAYKEIKKENIYNKSEYETHLHLIGICGIYDPPRVNIQTTIEKCKSAGIIPIMITGDHPNTAKFIAKKIGIITDDEKHKVISGSELEKKKCGNTLENIEQYRVFARVSPEQKLFIVTSLQSKNHVVAMTGDGVNDAPSLKAADIGIAMGITGTEVSKNTADMILMDDKYETVLNAIEQGRNIYLNIKKFIRYTLSSNLAEILVITLSPVFGFGILLYPIHILWINLITDGLPGIALGYEKEDVDVMKLPPRKKTEKLFSISDGIKVGLSGGLMFILTIAVSLVYHQYSKSDKYITIAFNSLVFIQLANSFVSRKEYYTHHLFNIFQNKIFLFSILLSVVFQVFITQVPLLNKIFKTSALTTNEWLICCIPAMLFMVVMLIIKFFERRSGSQKLSSST